MTLRQTIQAASEKAADLITKLSATSNQAIKTRENLFTDLSNELSHYVEIEEQHLLPLLRKDAETKDLAADALKGNKDLRAALEKLSGQPKDDDAFLEALADLKKGFQQHVRNERKELLPAVLKVLTDEEAADMATGIEDAMDEARKADRDEKREEAAQAKREAEEKEQAVAKARIRAAKIRKEKRDEKLKELALAKREAEEEKQAAAAKRAAVRTRKAAERAAREVTETVVQVMDEGSTAAEARTHDIPGTLAGRTQKIASDTREAMSVYGDTARKIFGDLQAVKTSPAVSTQVASEISFTWMDWFGRAARANAQASRQLMRSRSLKDIAEVQKEFATSTMQNWMDRRAAVLRVAQRGSEQGLSPLQAHRSDTA
ncbi:hemerythrin domain-containing protein [Paracoccus liaowanqingii]|nr:hemerythrin domain-containing protein [Paracoccus liaowanqingii]